MQNPKSFMLAGHSIFTLSNLNSGKSFTYRILQPREDGPHYAGILTGPDNTRDYTFFGTIFRGQNFYYSQKSVISEEALSVKGFEWFWRNLDHLPEFVRIDGCGYCHRCGRLLSDLESIETGFGPHCRKEREKVLA